jgi:tol-pal system protein YbgF
MITMGATGCLKTRAQLRDEGGADDHDGSTKPIPAQVQDVEPKGQYVIDEIKGELTRMTGRLEDLERQQKQASAAGTAAKSDEVKKLETRILELEQAQAAMLEAIKKIQAGAPPPDPAEAFEKGKAHFQAGNFDGAVESLSAYLKAPSGKHAEEATFLRGESYFQLKQYQRAITDYSKFPEKFNRSRKMPQALLRIGLSFEALGMKDDGKAFYQELVEKFPKSAEAKKARAKLK